MLGCLDGVEDCLLLNQGFSSEQRHMVFLHGEQDRFVPCLQGYICRQMPQYEWFWTPHPQPKAFPSPCWLEDLQPLLQELDREEPARADVSVSSARILKSGQGSESDRLSCPWATISQKVMLPATAVQVLPAKSPLWWPS